MRSITLILIFVIMVSYTSFAQQSSCDYKAEILVDGEEFEKEDFKWRMKATKIEGKSTNITGTVEIKTNGKIVKSYKPWTSDAISKQRTSTEYSLNLKEGEEYTITAEVNVECDDTNKTNNVDVKTIKIKDEDKEKSNIKNPETVYVSSNEKAKELIMIFLLTLSILLNVILIWKR